MIAGVAFIATAALSEPPPRNSAISSIDLNAASEADLQLLPGIGPAIAGRIVADRESRGDYRSLNDLTRVSGVGERTVRRLRGFATAGD